MIWIKFHSQGRDRLLAACDEELLGKKLGDFFVSERFYKGRLTSDKELIELLDDCTIANLIGEKVINTAKKKGLIQENSVILVGDVPHAQFVRML